MTTSCLTGVDVASLPDANKVSITQKIILASHVNGFLETRTSFVAVDTNLENKKRKIYNMLRYVQCRDFWSVEFVFRDLFGKTVLCFPRLEHGYLIFHAELLLKGVCQAHSGMCQCCHDDKAKG